MTGVRLTIQTEPWLAHLQTMVANRPGLVPVIKGNGYGFGVARLAARAQELGVSTIAVGSLAEARTALTEFAGDVVVMLPFFAADPQAEVAQDPRVIVTVAHLDQLTALAEQGTGARVIAEVMTSMCRHGFPVADLAPVAEVAAGVDLRGWTVHLPTAANNLAEARSLARAAQQAAAAPVWFSHVTDAEHDQLRAEFGPDTRLRRGTDLWLGRRDALATTATVLDVHKVVRGQRVGYHRRPVPGDGWVVVVAGGTAHGIGLEAPSTNRSLRDRAKTLTLGALNAAGRARSPFEIDGAKRDFIEPPHMQSSLVFLPAQADAPVIGAEVPVTVRNTTATFDEVRHR